MSDFQEMRECIEESYGRRLEERMRRSSDKHYILGLALSPTTIAIITLIALLPLSRTPLAFLLVGFTFVVVGPIALVIREARNKKTDLMVSRREKRNSFLLAAVLSYTIGLFLYWVMGSAVGVALAASYLFVTLAVLLINKKYTKISIHSAGVSGPLTLLVLVRSPAAAILLMMAPLILWSRYKVRAHSKEQLFLGFFVGLFITLIVFLFFFSFFNNLYDICSDCQELKCYLRLGPLQDHGLTLIRELSY